MGKENSGARPHVGPERTQLNSSGPRTAMTVLKRCQKRKSQGSGKDGMDNVTMKTARGLPSPLLFSPCPAMSAASLSTSIATPDATPGPRVTCQPFILLFQRWVLKFVPGPIPSQCCSPKMQALKQPSIQIVFLFAKHTALPSSAQSWSSQVCTLTLPLPKEQMERL